MNRRDFIKKFNIGVGLIAPISSLLGAVNRPEKETPTVQALSPIYMGSIDPVEITTHTQNPCLEITITDKGDCLLPMPVTRTSTELVVDLDFEFFGKTYKL